MAARGSVAPPSAGRPLWEDAIWRKMLSLQYYVESFFIVGEVLAILAVIDIIKKPITLVGKIICSVIVLSTNLVGALVYFLWARRLAFLPENDGTPSF